MIGRPVIFHQARQTFFKRYRRYAFGAAALVLGVILRLWLKGQLLFLHRYRPFLPSGVSASTQVFMVSYPHPNRIPKTYRRQLREYFDCYYPKCTLSGEWWKDFPKALTDVLDEYGAQVQDGKLGDASGRELRIGKKWATRTPQQAW